MLSFILFFQPGGTNCLHSNVHMYNIMYTHSYLMACKTDSALVFSKRKVLSLLPTGCNICLHIVKNTVSEEITSNHKVRASEALNFDTKFA